MKTPVAVTGFGCVTPLGVGIDTMWREIQSRGFHPRRHAGGIEYRGAPSANDLAALIEKRSYPQLPRTTLMALVAAKEAWSRASIGPNIEPHRIGIVLNREFGQQNTAEAYMSTLWTKGPAAVSGIQFVQTTANAVLGKLCLEFCARGPSLLTMGSSALLLAVDLLNDGLADVILCGGLDEASNYLLDAVNRDRSHIDTEEAGALDDFLVGEGACFLVLERHSFAAERGQDCMGYILGCSSLTDRRGIMNPVDRDAGDLELCIHQALRAADLELANVSLISRAQNGLACFDKAEENALRQLFGAGLPTYSSKLVVGETWGAAEAISVVAGIMGLRDLQRALPPSIRESFSDHLSAGLALSMNIDGQNHACVVSL